MIKRPSLLTMIFASAFFFVATSQAQDLNKQTTKPVRQTPKVVGPEKVEPEVVQETSEELLRKAITTLTEQVDKLTAEVKKMRQDSERNSTLLELSLLEERLTRIEDKLDAATSTKANLEAQDIDIQRRQRNVQQELILRGGALRREEAEAALRQEFQRTLDSIRSQQSALQTRISDLQSQADRLRFRIETLRKKAERLELKNESQQDK